MKIVNRLALALGMVASAALAHVGLRPLEAAEEAPPLREVVVAFKTHFDIGYTDLARNVVMRYRTSMIERALEVCDRSRELPPEQQFVWTLPGWPMTKILEDWPGQTEERRARATRAFREGRFVTHALPFTTHTETLDLEDLVRGLTFASRLSRDMGLSLPRDAKMTDVPCHTWVMPTLLKHAGVDFLHLGCNAASSSPHVPMIFWWEGPDGSRLLTMYSAAGYGTGLVPPEDWPHRTWLALVHTGDNHGPPTPEEVKRLLDEAGRKLPGVRVRIGRLSDFADALLAEKPDLPVVRGDMPDTWIHGPMCDPAGAAIARAVRPAIASAESLHTLLGAWGVDLSDGALLGLGATMESAYEQSLLYGEHTWGGALSWVTRYEPGKVEFGYGDVFRADLARGRFRRLEESWDEHTGYIEAARDRIAPALAAARNALAKAVGHDGPRIVVSNPLPWKRDGLVSIPWGGDPVGALEPADGGDPVPCEAAGGELRFVAPGVPSMGYRTFVPAKAPSGSRKPSGANAAPGARPASARRTQDAPAVLPAGSGQDSDARAVVIESPHLKAVLDPARGIVRSLVEKRTGRELAGGGERGFGEYLYERFDADQVRTYVGAYTKIRTDWALNELGKPVLPPAQEEPYRAASPRDFTIRIEESAACVAAEMSARAGAGVPHPVTVRLVLYRDLPSADLEITLREKPKDAWPEAGWLCFPLAVREPRFRLVRLASIVDPARDLVPGANHDLFWLSGGLAVTDGEGRGVGLCPLDHGLVSLERPGCWRYSTDFVPREAAVYVNLFNNQWSTNFRLYNGGTWTSRVRIWAVDRYDPESTLVTPSWEARFPLLAAAADGAAGSLPPSRAGLELSRRGILVTAFGPNPDGAGTVLRLWECAGISGGCEVRLPEGVEPETVQPVDLRGRPSGPPVPVRDRAFNVAVSGFAPASFVLKAAKG